MSYQIFISYRRIGGDALAFLIKERLQQAGYNVFFDVESLHSGKFSDELMRIIDECESFLLILSPNALDRCCEENDWILNEVSYAIKTKKNIIPVFSAGFEWPDVLPAPIEDLRYFNGVAVNYLFFDGFIDRLDSLIHSGNVTQYIEKKHSKHILIWADFESNILKRIIKKINPLNEYYIEILTEPIEILSKDLSLINSIIIIDTDVTKLSNNDYSLERINKALEEFVNSGGKLITTHDSIYRRTRNTTLQKMYGCQTTNFKQVKDIHYIKTEDCANSGMFSDIPSDFFLTDDELCWGELSPDVTVYFENEEKIPLVFSREYGEGICFWLNSGDFKKYPSESILKPDMNFINILKDILSEDI